MKEPGFSKSKIQKTLNVIITVILYLGGIAFFWVVFIGSFADKMCTDLPTCYAIAIFLAGTIITLEIKLLEEKNLVELILFLAAVVVNVGFISAGLFHDSIGNHDGAVLVINCTIWLDFIVFARCLFLLFRMYFKLHINIPKKAKKTKGADLFEYWLGKEEESNVIKRALTDKSFKQEDHNLETKDTNYELATYGDSILKVCFSQILFSEGKEKPSVERAKFESDEYLVKAVAKHYHLVDYIHINSHNQDMPKNYEYVKPEKKNKKSPHKYIATAVEAMVGAIYIETKDLKAITELAKTWMELKDVK